MRSKNLASGARDPGSAPAYWALGIEENLAAVGSSPQGVTSAAASKRLADDGPNSYRPKKQAGPIAAYLGQFKNPIVLLLLFAALLSLTGKDYADTLIIFAIVIASATLSFSQEHSAGNAVKKLLELVKTNVVAIRDGKPTEIPVEKVVRGDVIVLSAGSTISGDGVVIEANNLYVDQAALTGESFPAEKMADKVPADAAVSERTNVVYSGTHSISGSGKILVLRTGKQTEYGAIIDRLAGREPPTEFERGIRQFGHMLLEVTFVLTLGVFAINVYLQRNVLDSFMFALALAVGLTPQLLPAIISVNLSHGAQRMAKAKVIVKRLNSIENFGSMNLLCSDKTGTLTKGIVEIQGSYDPEGKTTPAPLNLARMNAKFQTGFVNPIDTALLEGADASELTGTVRGEIPYDFNRKRLSVFVEQAGITRMITKGAVKEILAVCTGARSADSELAIGGIQAEIHKQFVDFSAQGFRVLGVATKTFSDPPASFGPSLEADMCFEGFLVLGDPLREGIQDAIGRLNKLGVALKVITGDNELAAHHLGEALQFQNLTVLKGQDIQKLTDAALVGQAAKADIFAEIAPNQKERLILALQRSGFVVGYIGDGINDGTALRASDVGISVANAVPVAKDAADIVMLESGLDVLVGAVEEGRRTFANTMKYVFMATSANFGNMFSMAGASAFLPFLPLLPKQVLLNNLLSDIPQITIAADVVDQELVDRPRRWNVVFLRKFMAVFGFLNSAADYGTFGFLILVKAPAAVFRTTWFIENIVTATLAVFVVRTRRPFYKSRPCPQLIWATLAAITATIALPYTAFGGLLGFVPLSIGLIGAVAVICGIYLVVVEAAKHVFYVRVTGG